MLKESFSGQWQPLISLWTRRNRLINNKPLGIVATWHLNINSVHVKYFYITILKTLNKCQGLKNYHFGSLLATKFYGLAIRAPTFRHSTVLGFSFPEKILSFWTIKRAVWNLTFENFITIYKVWALVTLHNFHSLSPTPNLQFLSILGNSIWSILHSILASWSSAWMED